MGISLQNGNVNSSVLITGVGAVIGQGIIKALREVNLPFRLVGIDSNPFSIGFMWTDTSYTVPRSDDPAWLASIIEICRKENVVLILPGIEQDIKALLQNREEFAKHTNALPLLNSPEALRVGFDKWELYCFARQHGVKVPLTWLMSDTDINSIPDGLYPLILKPRRGNSGKGIHKVEAKEDLEYWLRHIQVTDYMIQQYVGDDNDEYTVSVFGFKDGTLSEPISLKRRLSHGATFEAETICDINLSEEVSRIARELNIQGPTNFQFRKAGGDYFLIEVNPRFSSSTSIKMAFGFNEPLMAIKSFIFEKPQTPLRLKKGRCLRYLADSIIFYPHENPIDIRHTWKSSGFKFYHEQNKASG